VQDSLKIILKPLTIIVGVFFISFLSFLAILTWDRTDNIAIFLSYLLSFGFACVVNVFVLSHFGLLLKQSKEKFAVLNEIASMDGEILCFVDNKLNCLGYTSEDSHAHTFNNRKLPSILAELDISHIEIAQIENFIKGYSKNVNSERLHKHLDTLYVSDIRYNYSNCDLVIKPLKLENGLYCIKLRQSFTSNNYQMFYEQLPIGYFELDKYGFITKANIHLANSIGYKLSEFFETSIALKDLIINESVGNIDDSIPKPNYLQKFVTIRTKHNDIDNFLLVLVNKCDETNTITKAYGFLIRLRQKEISYFTDHLEKHWVDYSWKCFFDKSPYPVCILDESGKILRFNQTFLKLTSKKNLEGVDFSGLFIEESGKVISGKVSTIASGFTEPENISGMMLKNSSKVFEVFLSKILNLDGRFHGFMVRVTDVTQQKQLEENLSHAQRMQTIGQLAGSVAHDFNNILTAISGFCDLLLLRHGMGDPSFSNIMQIKQSADRASSLVNRLLAFSRKQTLKLRVVSPIDLFSEFAPLIHRLIGTRIKFSQQIDPDIWHIKVDTVQMEQVILNLVVNAQQAIGDEGELNISVENFTCTSDTKLSGYVAPPGEKRPPYGDYVKISVEDTGCGIEKENIKSIFEPFYSTKSNMSGTGLGLSTVYGVIRQSEAYIFVKSAIGKGTEFIILFPKYDLIEEDVKDIRSKTQKEVISSDVTGSGVIVLVEDEDAIRMFAKNVLTNKGYSVIDFASGKDALEEIKRDNISFDLLITDVLMPEMSGPNLVTKLQEIKPKLKVIFISGYAEEAFTEEYGEKRDFDFLAKPFSLRQLLATVKDVISS
jgi:two-component system cell cycle sensor histidine kinase/response regulator CckA